jgi:hypothetical protein
MGVRIIGYLSAPYQFLEEAKTIFKFCQWQHEFCGKNACPAKKIQDKRRRGHRYHTVVMPLCRLKG